MVVCAMPTPHKSRKQTRQRISEETWRDVKRAFLVGGELRDLARKLKLNENTVLARAARERWTEQRNGAVAKVRGGAGSVSESTQELSEQSLAISRKQLLDEHLCSMLFLSQRLSRHAANLPTEEAFDRIRNVDAMDKLTRRQLGLDGPSSAAVNVCVSVGPWGRSDNAPAFIDVEEI
jgi:hypothetical protein